MKITHVMADGTVTDSIQGRTVPAGNEALKRVLAEIIRRLQSQPPQKTA